MTQQHRRLTRAEARAQTVARVLDSAEALFLERGYSGVSIAEIADRAGYTVGAVYANFANKDALFLAVARRLRARDDEELAAVMAAAADPVETVHAVGRWHADLRRRHQNRMAVMAEFWLFAARDPALGAEAAEGYAAARDMLVDLLGTAAERFGITPPQPLERLATVLIALRRGIESQSMYDADAVDDLAFPCAVASVIGLDPSLVRPEAVRGQENRSGKGH